MLKNLTKEIVDQLNYFLSTDNWPVEWGKQEEWKEMKISDNLTDIEILKIGLAKLECLCKDISKSRNFSETGGYYKYHAESHKFTAFRIDDHFKTLNDKMESKWFNYFVKVFVDRHNLLQSNYYIDLFNESVKNMTILATYVTTSLTNHRFMVVNYGDKYVAYDKKSVNKEYDGQYSEDIKPIRGFVRYNHHEKDALVTFVEKAQEINRESTNLLLLIISLFFKGNCISCEAEYRFILLSPKGNVEARDLQIEPMLKGKITCDFMHLNKSEFYEDEQYVECEKTSCTFDSLCSCSKEEEEWKEN